MKLKDAWNIFYDIQSSKHSDEEKARAIMQVCGMETHNSVTKDAMLRVIWYLLNELWELPEDAKAPDSWKKGDKDRGAN